MKEIERILKAIEAKIPVSIEEFSTAMLKGIKELSDRLDAHEAKEAQFMKDYGVTLDSYLANLPTPEDAEYLAEREEK